MKMDLIVTTHEDLRHLLSTLRFWGSDLVPDSMLEFVLAGGEDGTIMSSVLKEFSEELRYVVILDRWRTAHKDKLMAIAMENGMGI